MICGRCFCPCHGTDLLMGDAGLRAFRLRTMCRLTGLVRSREGARNTDIQHGWRNDDNDPQCEGASDRRPPDMPFSRCREGHHYEWSRQAVDAT